MHLDLAPTTSTRDEEVDRLVALGATVHADHRNADGTGWVTLFAGRGAPDWYAHVDWDAQPDWEFDTARVEPLADSIARYEAACERSRAAASGRGLDDLGSDRSGPPFSLRFVYLHMIEETARHLGHLDLLRELLDGSTGE